MLLRLVLHRLWPRLKVCQPVFVCVGGSYFRCFHSGVSRAFVWTCDVEQSGGPESGVPRQRPMQVYKALLVNYLTGEKEEEEKK